MSAEPRPRQPLVGGVHIAAMAAILLLAAGLRLQGLRWDAACPPRTATGASACTETHLHPDERFLTMVAAAIEFPDSIGAYFDTKSSPANPHNRGHGFFPYGLFPVLTVKALAAPFGLGGYDQVHLAGRVVSALCDLLSICLLFVLARRLYDPELGVLAALLLALAVLPIQQAHFFTADSMATAASMLALLCALGIARRGRWRDFLYFGLALGLAVAIKVSVASLAVLALAAVWTRARHRRRFPSARPTRHEPLIAGLGLAAVVALMVFRLLNPYAFAGPGLLGLGLNPTWLANMKEVGELMGGWRDVPPGHQWTDRAALWFPWKNMVLVGLGPALGIAAWVGWAGAGVQMFRRRRLHHLLPWLWIAVLFAHQGTQWVKSLRYLLPIYPALALFAALLLVGVWRRAQRSDRRLAKWAAAALTGSVVIGTLAWAWAFTAIYRRPHSRVEASRWIYQNFPAGSAIAHETWDDPLPVALDGLPGMGQYRGLALHPYAEDSPAKLEEMLHTLDQVDLLVVSSNRVYDSVARLPMRFPMTVRYYEALFSGALGFERVAEFTSYPSLFGVALPDQGVEEAFSVYDHPRVQLFAPTERWSVAAARELLDLGDWSGVLQLTPREAARYRGLELPPARIALQQRGGTWMLPEAGAPAGVDAARFPADRGEKASLLLWILCLQWLGLIAFPLAAPALRGLPDRGWLLSKTIGLLLLAYLGWLAGSLGWLRFGPPTLRWLALLLTVAALAAAWRARRDLAEFALRRWRLLLAEEVLFWGFFAFMLWLRYLNPDLWHPFRGGEKPMDLAYFNAVVRSTAFPPYDPWFAGGTLNYYYFGFVLAGSLTLLSRVPTAIAYNLAVPTFFALTAAGAASAAGALAAPGSAARRHGLRWLGWGLAGAAAIVMAGNQGVPRLFAESLARLSKLDVHSRIPLLPELARFLDGAVRWISGASLGVEDHWLYWAPSRSIPYPPTESSPITEFPFFTFLFGDLHAHMMAMPITLLTIAVLVSMVRRAPHPASERWEPEPRVLEEVSGLALLALTVGALAAINTWDWPTLLGLTGAAFLIRELEGDRPASAPLRAAWRFGLVAIAGRLLYLPFHHHFVSAYGRVEPWQGSRTPLHAFLVIHALFLLPIVAWLLSERRPWQATARARARSGSLDRIVEYSGLGLAALLTLLGFPLEALLIAVTALTTGLALTPGRGGSDRLVAAFVLAGAALAIAVEHLVLTGDVSRMNTVFKTYLQIWILWGLASTYALAALSRVWRGWEPDPSRATRPAWRSALIALWVLLLAGAVTFPLLGIPARLRDRFAGSTDHGLDGRAFMAGAVYGDEHGEIELRWDGEAIRWLDRHVAGSPVVLEASTPIYRWGSRISVHTGLPTVLGWDWHQQQQRAILKNDPIGHRRQDVTAMYSAETAEEILPLLRRHRVRYVVVGRLERLYYPEAGLDKFARGAPFREVYRNPGTVIYEVAPAPLPG